MFLERSSNVPRTFLPRRRPQARLLRRQKPERADGASARRDPRPARGGAGGAAQARARRLPTELADSRSRRRPEDTRLDRGGANARGRATTTATTTQHPAQRARGRRAGPVRRQVRAIVRMLRATGWAVRATGWTVRATWWTVRAIVWTVRATGWTVRAKGWTVRPIVWTLRATGWAVRATGWTLRAIVWMLRATGWTVRAATVWAVRAIVWMLRATGRTVRATVWTGYMVGGKGFIVDATKGYRVRVRRQAPDGPIRTGVSHLPSRSGGAATRRRIALPTKQHRVDAAALPGGLPQLHGRDARGAVRYHTAPHHAGGGGVPGGEGPRGGD
eukprot:873283-Pyramimonas_sp.AAC.1